MENTDEIKYIKQILAGETNLFSIFLHRYSKSVYGLIFRMIPIKEDAEELTQDTFLKAFKKLDTFKGDSSFSTWLFRIAYNTAISATRKKKIIYPVMDENQLNEIADENVNSFFDNDNEELIKQLEIAIDQLDFEEKTLVTVFYLEEKSVADVSIILGLSVENVRVRLHRVRKKLFVLIKNQSK